MTVMRAKLMVTSIQSSLEGEYPYETLEMTAVSKSNGYPADGSDEDNTFAKWSPSARFSITINNPALHGKFKTGQKFYVDFTEASQ